MPIFNVNPRHILPAVGVAAAMLFGAAPEAQANTTNIKCPVQKIKREVSTSLPGGWWNTPIVSSLQDTKIVTIGGKKALQCRYGAAGNIQRYAPKGRICKAQTGGFRCSTLLVGSIFNPAVKPKTHKTGPISLPQTYQVDFDTGLVRSSGADLWFQAVNSSTLLLTPRNGAKIALGNLKNRGFSGCSRASFSTSRVRLSDVPINSYVCVKTNEGRVSQFRLNGVQGGATTTLKMGYTTWKK